MKSIDEYAIYSRAERLRAKNTRRVNPFYEDRKIYPSVAPKTSSTNLKPRMQYTGTYIIGIGTMHKSNPIPVTSDEQVKDIARMRR
jgi:hypothetical protein